MREILERHAKSDARVYVVWLPMLATDARSEWDADVLPDPRVRHFWDGSRVVATWFADENLGGLGYSGIVWDAFFAFGPGARWTDRPRPLTASGAPVVSYTTPIDQALGRTT